MKSMNKNKELKSVEAPRELSHGVLMFVAKISLPTGRQAALQTSLKF